MNVKIIKIYNKGDYDKEYVSLEVMADCEIGMYMISDTTYTEKGEISNKIRHVYWFPDKKVKKDDFVWLFTRPKKSTDKNEWSNKSNTMTHAFYWDLKTAVWNDKGNYAILFEIKEWAHKKVSEAV